MCECDHTFLKHSGSALSINLLQFSSASVRPKEETQSLLKTVKLILPWGRCLLWLKSLWSPTVSESSSFIIANILKRLKMLHQLTVLLTTYMYVFRSLLSYQREKNKDLKLSNTHVQCSKKMEKVRSLLLLHVMIFNYMKHLRVTDTHQK